VGAIFAKKKPLLEWIALVNGLNGADQARSLSLISPR
jgi:hypothetical protein